MCQSYEMTKTQKDRAMRCPCKAPKKTLTLYSCCGWVNVLCPKCQRAGQRFSDAPPKSGDRGFLGWGGMDEKTGSGPGRTKAINAWNDLVRGGVL